MENKLPDDIIITIIDKLNLCKFQDNSKIATICKRWNKCTEISVQKCKKYKYYGDNEVCSRHVMFYLCKNLGNWYNSIKNKYFSMFSNFVYDNVENN